MENNKAIKILSIAVGALLVLTLWNTIRIESLRSSLKEPAKAELPVKEDVVAKFKENTVMFIFDNDRLCATAIYTNDWE